MTNERFCELYNGFFGEEIDHVEQVVQLTLTGKELMEFAEFIQQQTSKGITRGNIGKTISIMGGDAHLPISLATIKAMKEATELGASLNSKTILVVDINSEPPFRGTNKLLRDIPIKDLPMLNVPFIPPPTREERRRAAKKKGNKK